MKLSLSFLINSLVIEVESAIYHIVAFFWMLVFCTFEQIKCFNPIRILQVPLKFEFVWNLLRHYLIKMVVCYYIILVSFFLKQFYPKNSFQLFILLKFLNEIMIHLMNWDWPTLSYWINLSLYFSAFDICILLYCFTET